MLWLELINGVHKKRLGQITSVRMCAGDRCQSGTSRRELSTFFPCTVIFRCVDDLSYTPPLMSAQCARTVLFPNHCNVHFRQINSGSNIDAEIQKHLTSALQHCLPPLLTLFYFTRAVVMQFVTFFPFFSSPTLHLSFNQIIIACRLSVKW